MVKRASCSVREDKRKEDPIVQFISADRGRPAEVPYCIHHQQPDYDVYRRQQQDRVDRPGGGQDAAGLEQQHLFHDPEPVTIRNGADRGDDHHVRPLL